MDSGEQGKGFQVRDRRRFTDTGELREGDSSAEASEPSQDPGEAPQAPPVAPKLESAEPLEITMATFLMSLSTQALVLLGDFPDPVTGQTEADLPGAQEIISLIAMLKEKTRGNLDPAETSLIDKILFDLRMRYVEKVRK
jgi:hypothetical protein